MYKLDHDDFDDKEYQLNIIRVNTKLLGKTYDWLKLIFMEILFIKECKSALNAGLKATKEICNYFDITWTLDRKDIPLLPLRVR